MAAPIYTVTANRTDDGAVVYLTRDGRAWTYSLQEALRTPDTAERDAAVAWAKTQEREVCDPYSLTLQEEAGRLVPTSARERIRSEGPDVTLRRLGYSDRGERAGSSPTRRPAPPASRAAGGR